MNLDKIKLVSLKFEEIAQKISKELKTLKMEYVDFVGLEQLDGEDIHIRRKGVPSDVSSKRLYQAGDILFGKETPI